MYKNFFGLRENPFNVNPDPRFLYLSPQTQKALDELTYGIQNRKGLILLTGEVGTGKTTRSPGLFPHRVKRRYIKRQIGNPCSENRGGAVPPGRLPCGDALKESQRFNPTTGGGGKCVR